MKRIWVLDDHQGPAGTIEKEAQRILAQAAGLEVKRVGSVDALRKRVTGSEVPNLIVVDLDMGMETVNNYQRPRESGLAAISFLEENLPYTPYLIYSDINDYGGGRVLSAMAAFRFTRPAGIVPKDNDEELARALTCFFTGRRIDNETTDRYRLPRHRDQRAVDVLFSNEQDLLMWQAHAAGSGASSNKASKWRADVISRVLSDEDLEPSIPEQLRMLEFPASFDKDSKGNRNTKDALMHFAIRHRMTLGDPAFERLCRNNLWN
ncbi:hypothetical protein KIH31_15305 [Paenarthrobacter sp. DKR-5]|uniref:hypothetical protein n=1 Tax=Paenarthrobacter sp. DKR-5 TaxID=2835535 RepID=UPI001BDCAAD8|nr:hypothetical protein [Paenarthrobacter sp. DKR-5]MBT1003957.1 hypothetical protein [Paenarthrobacter sp. DKR-5]